MTAQVPSTVTRPAFANVWLANNWKTDGPALPNPGGYQIVAFLGLAEPIRTPLIGPPQRPY